MNSWELVWNLNKCHFDFRIKCQNSEIMEFDQLLLDLFLVVSLISSNSLFQLHPFGVDQHAFMFTQVNMLVASLSSIFEISVIHSKMVKTDLKMAYFQKLIIYLKRVSFLLKVNLLPSASYYCLWSYLQWKSYHIDFDQAYLWFLNFNFY